MCRAGMRVSMLAAVLFGLGGCAAPPRDTVLVERGAGAFAAGDAKAAEAALDEALAVNPDNGAALLSLGALYEHTGRAEAARRIYGDAIARFGPVAAATLGSGSSERAAFAALARIRLARLDASASAKSAPPLSAAVIRAVFGNLKRVTANLEALSETVRAAAVQPAAARPETAAPGAAPPSPKAAEETPKSTAETPKSTAASEAEAPKTETPVKVAAAPAAVRVHLASYRSAKNAKRGWKLLSTRYPALLGGLTPATVRVDLGPGMGIYFRLVAGPFSGEDAARALCRALKRKGAYCTLLFG